MELKGFKGISAWMVYNKLIFNLPLLPHNMVVNRDWATEVANALVLGYDDMVHFIAGLGERTIPSDITPAVALAKFKMQDDKGRRNDLLGCIAMGGMTDEEGLRLLSLHKDANGINYSKASIGNLKVRESMDMILDTLVACSYVDIDLSMVTSKEIEMLDGYRVSVQSEATDILSHNSTVEIDDLLSLSVKKAIGGLDDRS